ncbi:hypothetical protein HUS23_12295 [Ectothiorhodospiraceae bacterium 2226]|nr:hypothetical protein HUS23_12295 [Ectothiorhodospiraceae bacterium 2226]
MINNDKRRLGLILGALVTPPLWAAGGHYEIDDAAIADPGTCQLEAWYTRLEGGDYAINAAPACSIGSLELTLKGDFLRAEGWQRAYMLQGKWLGRELTDQRWGWALSAAAVHDRTEDRIVEYVLNLPVSIPFAQGATVAHLNLGATEQREGPRQRAVRGGVGIDRTLTAHLHGIAEVYGTDRGERAAQLGLRALPVTGADKHLDISYGRTLRNDADHWFIVGFAVRY